MTVKAAQELWTGPGGGCPLRGSVPVPTGKYRPYEPIGLADRTWPDRVLRHAPTWASVDLRDGNQSLIEPMDVPTRRRMFDLLVAMGFKEIEVGYPTASQDDYDFLRHLVKTDAIPEDVCVQVMSPIRDDFIERTVRCLEGTRRAVLQVFNPTSEVQRRLVFRTDRAQTLALALDGAVQARALQDSLPGTELYLQYAPESFTQTEPDFALEICNAVLEHWSDTPHPVRINLPATVEVFPPQEFADRIEYISRHLVHRDRTMLSVHPHNDRGSAVAAAEMAVLAGADRIEGTLFGNGERTGNVCLVTLAMNLLTQGVDPGLDLGDIDGIRQVAESCTKLPVHPRHPWAGEFVYTSFAGTHQDAISKGLKARATEDAVWDVPYLAVDPGDVGRDYQALIRINAQSGKGGMAYVLRTAHGLELPRRLQIDFAAAMQQECESTAGEITPDRLWSLFEERYIAPGAEPCAADLPDHRDLRDHQGPQDAQDLRDPHDPAAPAPGDTEELWAAYAQRLADAHDVTAAGAVTVRDVETGAVVGRDDEVAAYCEVAVGTRAVWGVGIGGTRSEAVARAVRSAVRRIERDSLFAGGAPAPRRGPLAASKARP